jgi:hypothetical protein
MSACAEQTFTGISQARFDCLVERAKAETGVTLTGPSGTVSQSGFTVTWNFDANSQTLAIQFLDSPFFVSCGTIQDKVQGLVDGCSAA